MDFQEILKRYKDSDKRTREYMEFFYKNLEEKYGEVSESFLPSLDMLSFNLDLMFMSWDDIKTNGVKDEDKYRGQKKSASLQSFYNAQNYIHKLISYFGFTPMAKSKIKAETDAGDVAKYLESLTK